MASSQTATFASGCYWCTEAVMQRVKGVEEVVSGFSTTVNSKDPRVESVQVTFDPDIVSYRDLLEIFWGTHDPTTPNRQGNDVGPQYRSMVLYHSEEQREQAEWMMQRLESQEVFSAPIVTEVAEFGGFSPAPDSEQDFYNKGTKRPYCQLVISPKLSRLRNKFADRLK